MSDFERRYNLADTAEDKIDLIRSLAIPNTREDILELFLLASSNVDADSYVKAANDRGDKKEGAERLELTEAWIAKMEQTYQKAKILLAGDASMEKIERIYQKTVVKVSKGKRKGWIAGHKEGFLLLLCVIALFSLCIRVNCYSRESKEKEEALVAEIRQDIDEGNYDVALTKAAQLDKELRDVFISQISEKQGKAKIPDEDLDGRVYTDAVLQFQKAGFTNITTEVMPQDDGLYEFFFGRKDNEGEVAEITIDGSTSFTRGSYISKDAVIIIRYYSYKDGETGGTVSSAGTELATTPEEQLVGTPCSTVVQKFSDAGFTNISTKVVTNTNSAKSGLVIEISVDGKTDYTLDTAFPQNVEIVIRYFQYC